jgi:chondroitin 4-sulfotransferase 11
MRWDQYEYMRFFNIALHERKAIYFFIPKVACTSLKRFMAETLGIYNPPLADRLLIRLGRKKQPHDEFWHWQHYPFVVDASRFDDYYKFAFVRNPWDRLVSCYYNKLKAGCPGFKRYGFDSGMSFSDFAERVCEIPDENADMHIRSQTSILRAAGNVKMDFVGHLENFNEDFSVVCQKLSIPFRPLPRLMRTGKKPAGGVLYSQDLFEAVGHRYDADISQWGIQSDMRLKNSCHTLLRPI